MDVQSSGETQTRRPKVRVFLDPDGTGGDIIGVIVAGPTEIEYGTQCEGVLTDERYLEGYFVPLSGVLFEPDVGRISAERLREPFHGSGACLHAKGGIAASEFEGVLRGAVNELPFWHLDDDGRTHRSRLELDASRLSEAVEGWVPVKTPLGRGVLVWPNCD